PGWHLDRSRFDKMLYEMAGKVGATVWDLEKLLGFERKGAIWHLKLKTSEGVKEVACRWLLDCTGRSSRIATGLGIERHYEDQLLAFYARFRPDEHKEEDQDSRTLVESAPNGWFHTALLPSRERVVTFFTDANIPLVKQAKSTEGFLQLIQGAIHISE